LEIDRSEKMDREREREREREVFGLCLWRKMEVGMSQDPKESDKGICYAIFVLSKLATYDVTSQKKKTTKMKLCTMWRDYGSSTEDV
jgi:hypothetical protein